MRKMSELKHTPRPWVLSPNDSGEIFGYGSDYYAVCEVVSGIDQAANAQLIAAAPDLLAACQLAVEAIRECDMEVGIFGVPEDEIMAKLRDAINKAIKGDGNDL